MKKRLSPSARGLGIVWAVGTALLILTLVDTIVRKWNEVFDDAFISFRYAQNLASGAGLVWN